MPNDILLDENFEPQIKDGDFIIGESTYQHQKTLLFAEKGEFKSNPTTGVGTRKYLETSKPDEFAREIRLEFFADGMQVNSLKVDENLAITIDAIYK
ncbi:hypothetical protein ASG31_08450 [Chryseobacterium sp. Leaf404]|uniref:hypothetical protein n=1 Tax=unclassified Chryseobacterium TaxID=2593645 RepID=UPI0006F5727D|nr:MULTISPECIES: hypothetical protein [unclassified Chryseobacterium]KQT17431.1 hypothetical protein ASG31_08450 [Chryseobacterium sp. Leaf404]